MARVPLGEIVRTRSGERAPRTCFVRQSPCSISTNGDNRRLADAKQIPRGFLNSHANGIPGCQVDPVEGSLHVRQTLFEFSNDIGIGSDTEAYAIDHARKAHVGL